MCGTGLNGLPCLVFVNSAARGDLASYASATMTGGVAAQLVWMPVVPSVAAIRERSGRPFGNMRACAKRACLSCFVTLLNLYFFVEFGSWKALGVGRLDFNCR